MVHAEDMKKAPGEPEATKRNPRPTWVRELIDILESERWLCPYRRYVLERIDGELVFRQPEVDAIVDDAIDEAFGKRPAGRRIIKLP